MIMYRIGGVGRGNIKHQDRCYVQVVGKSGVGEWKDVAKVENVKRSMSVITSAFRLDKSVVRASRVID